MKKLLILFVAVAAFACSKDEPDPKTDFIRGTEWEYVNEDGDSEIVALFETDKRAKLYIMTFRDIWMNGAAYPNLDEPMWGVEKIINTYFYDYVVDNTGKIHFTIQVSDAYKDMPPLTGHVDNNTLLLQKQDGSTYATLKLKN